MHSPALFAKRIFLVKRSEGGQLPRYGQQYPVVKGLRPGADLLNLRYRRLRSVSKGKHALGYGSFRLGTYDARTRCIQLKCSPAAMLLREDRRDSHWRRPWTPDSLTLVSEMTYQKSLHRACHRHLSMVGLFLLLVCQNRHHLLSLLSGFTPCHRGIK